MSPGGEYDADVLILALDRVEETLAAIASARAQTGVRKRVIVVDQGSRPENFFRISAVVVGCADVTLLRAEKNLGVAGGRNLAAAQGRARVIVALDNDAEFSDAHTLARAVAALDAEPDLAALGFRIVTHALGTDDLSSWGYPRALLPRAGENFDTATFVGAGHAIRRQAWEQVGGYDSRLFFCWEEYDFSLAAIALGWRIRYRGDIVVRHKVSPEARHLWSGTRWFFFVRNRLYVGRKHGAAWGALAVRYGAYLLRGARNGLLWPTLRALPAAIAMVAQATPQALPPQALTYLRRTDAAHRGSLASRLTGEVLALLPGHLRR